MFLKTTVKIDGLAVYSYDNQTEGAAGRRIEEGTDLRVLPWEPEDGYTAGYDQWQAADAAALVLGGGRVGLAACIGGVWFDTDMAALLQPTGV